MTDNARRALAFASLALALVNVVGCSPGKAPPASLSPADLQRDLSGKLQQMGTPAKSVTCAKGLPAEVGGTARCSVEFSPANSVEASLTTTRVDAGMVEFEITSSSLNKQQLDKRVAALAAVVSANCDSGVRGSVGEWTRCSLARETDSSPETVVVDAVKGLQIDLKLRAALPQRRLENQFADQLTAILGRPPDSVRCDSDLDAEVGSTVACVVTIDGNPDPFVLRSAGIVGGMITFTGAPRGKNPEECTDFCIN